MQEWLYYKLFWEEKKAFSYGTTPMGNTT